MRNPAIPSALNRPGLLGELLVPQKLSTPFVLSKQELGSERGMKLVFSALETANERRDMGGRLSQRTSWQLGRKQTSSGTCNYTKLKTIS